MALSAGILLFPHRAGPWLLLVAFNLGVGAILLTGGMERARRFARGEAGAGGPPAGAPPWLRRGVGFVADWYALLLLPFLYWELPALNTAVWGGHYFDAMVQGWETAVFGGQPAITMWQRWSSPLVSEPLHLAYLSYYPILYLFPAIVYLRRGRAALYDTLFAMMLGFAAHYLVFIFFPVEGPYFVFPAPGEPVSAGLFYGVVHFVLGNGASAGTAFPSSHVAVSTVQTANAIRHLPVAAPILAVCVLGIAAGAVYAGIHYAIDVVVGLGTGALVAVLAPAVRRRLE